MIAFSGLLTCDTPINKECIEQVSGDKGVWEWGTCVPILFLVVSEEPAEIADTSVSILD